jgi:hypothetical protein
MTIPMTSRYGETNDKDVDTRAATPAALFLTLSTPFGFIG